MQATGIVRQVDELGRLVLPKSVRDALGFVPGTRVQVDVDDDGRIVLRRVEGPSLAEALELLRDLRYHLRRHLEGKAVDWQRLAAEIDQVLGDREGGC